jgi:hypothetical protein
LIFHSSALDFLLVVDEKMNGFVEPGVYVLWRWSMNTNKINENLRVLYLKSDTHMSAIF